MDDFIFGTTGFSERRAVQFRQQLAGVVHHHRTEPLSPRPGQPVTIWLWVGDGQRIDAACCYYTTDGSDPRGRRGRAETGRAIPLTPAEVEWVDLRWAFGRWWRGELPPQPAGTLVRYRLEAFSAWGGDSVWADGGARFACLVDESQPPAWAREAIIYQIFVDRFYPGNGRPWLTPEDPAHGFYGGTLQGVIDQLDYIAAAGFTAIWLTPIFASPSHHGYDATDYYRIEPRLGDNATLKRLVQEAHGRGLKVILDFVANHCSHQHPFFQAAQQDRTSPYYPWFTFQQWPHDYATFFGVKWLPQWNLDYPPARQYLIEIACHWLTEYGVDGYRLDYTLGPSHDFWTEFRQATRRVAPDSFTIAEAVESPQVMRTYTGRLDGCLDFPFAQVARQTFAFDTLDMAQLDAFLSCRAAYFPDNLLLGTFLDNHDMNRFLWLAKDKRRLRLAALFQFTQASPPVVYYGTEVGLSQTGDVRTPRGNTYHHFARAPMLWGDDQDTDLLACYRRLAALRRDRPAIRAGDRLTLHLDAAAGTYAYGVFQPQDRQNSPSPGQDLRPQASNLQSPALIVALNNSDTPTSLVLPVGRLGLADGVTLKDVLNGGKAGVTGGEVVVNLAGRSGLALVSD